MKKIKTKKLKLHKIERVWEQFCSNNKKFYTEPYEIIPFVESLGFQLIPAEMDYSKNSVLIVDTEKDYVDISRFSKEQATSNKVIVYNSDNKQEDINYIIAHAVSHYVWALSEKNEDQSLKIDEEYIYQENDSDVAKEYIFNTMSMCILIPKIDFYYDLSDIKQQKRYETKGREELARQDVVRLAEKYKVSYPLLVQRLTSFKMQ